MGIQTNVKSNHRLNLLGICPKSSYPLCGCLKSFGFTLKGIENYYITYSIKWGRDGIPEIDKIAGMFINYRLWGTKRVG